MKLQVVGCSHHGASVELRERLAFSPEQARTALADWRKEFPGTEAVLLSTCNRVEVYTATDDDSDEPSHEQVVQFLADFHNINAYDVFDDLFERIGKDAVRHLFTVAASLDSMVVGEPQILAQVKQAYQLARVVETTGPVTNTVFQTAVKVARRVSSETRIQQRRVSIPSVAVADFATQIFETFHDKLVLVLGAGEMGEETLVYLREQGAKNIVVVNRNFERAEKLAEKFSGQARPWEELLPLLGEADLVVATTGASEPVVGLDAFRSQVAPRRGQRPLFVLDLAMPRDFEPAIGDQLGVYLYSIDDLDKACQRNRALREKELPQAMAIVEEETDRFISELNHRATAPIIRRLRHAVEGPKQDELQRLFNKLPDLDERQQAEVAESFDRLVNKLLHPPLESLRDEAREGSPHGLIEALKRLFQIGD